MIETRGGAESFLWLIQKRFGFSSHDCNAFAGIPPIPKTELLAKIIHAHSLPLLEIAPKPCYKKLHPK
jgi:hypothetical protein